jgi:hypothetical protein
MSIKVSLGPIEHDSLSKHNKSTKLLIGFTPVFVKKKMLKLSVYMYEGVWGDWMYGPTDY